jgi:hypothetical protein
MGNQSPMLIQEDNHQGGMFKAAMYRAQAAVN